MPVGAWIGIGCGTLVLIAGVAMILLIGFCKHKVGEFTKNPEKAAAELIVKMNPDLTKVSQNDAKGEMTYRTKDGQEVTMSYKDISEGKFTVKDAKGNIAQFGKADLSNVPAWVPRVPKLQSAVGAFHNQEVDKVSGLYSASSDESPDRLEEFFKAEAGKLKLTESSRQAIHAEGVENRTATYQGTKRQLNIIITGKPGEAAQIQVGYEEKK